MALKSRKDQAWVPPVEFYFQVQFHFGTQRFEASFMEVSGLEQEMIFQETNNSELRYPKEVKCSNIILKRPLEAISEEVTAWIKKCMTYRDKGFIVPCTMVIFLMDAQRHSVACWACNRAYPLKWSLGVLDAQKSGLAIETLTLTINQIERKK